MWLVLPAAYLLGAILLHAVAARLRPAGNRVHQFLFLGTVAGLALIGHAFALPETTLPARVAAILLYAFGCELYVFLFTFVTSSVSVALLVSPGDGRSATDPSEMVRRRLETMHAAGLLQASAGRYTLSPRALRLVNFYHRLRDFSKHPASP